MGETLRSKILRAAPNILNKESWTKRVAEEWQAGYSNLPRNPMMQHNMDNENMATAYGASDAPPVRRPQTGAEKYAMWSAKGVTRVGTVNVTTLYQPGKLRSTIHEIDQYKWDVLGIAETHWTGIGELREGDVKILYSGKENGIHREGVAILLNKEASKSYIQHTPVSPRIISVRLKGHHKTTKIVQVYAPDSGHPDEDVEDFYEQLGGEINNTNENDILIVMGDFNSKIGKDNRGYEEVMGPFGIGTRNERGERMLEFCQQHQLFITNTKFYHREGHRHTWTHPNQINKNCIDYVLVKRRWISSVTNTKVMMSADFGSSHELVMSNFKLKFKTTNQPLTTLTRLNTGKLKDPKIREEYEIRIGGRFEPLLQAEGSTDDIYKQGRDIILEEAEQLLGKRRRIKQQWMTEEILQKCDERRQAKKRKKISPTQENQQSYRRLCREVESKCKEGKKRWIEQLCEKCESSYRSGQTNQLYRTVKDLTRVWSPQTNIVKNEAGQKTSLPSEVERVWREYYQGVLTGNDIQVDERQYPELMTEEERNSTPEILLEETEQQISSLQNEKAPGMDGITAELLKAGGNSVARWLNGINQRILNGEPLPEDWEQSIIIPIHKKGDTMLCSNHRPISLLSHAYKALIRVIQSRMHIKKETVMGEEQAGFRPGRGTTDQIFGLSQIVEKMWEYGRDLYCVFIDFKQAFDSVWRKGLIQVLRRFGFEEPIIETIRRVYENTNARVRKGTMMTDSFRTNTGVIQGCPLSPHLFNLFLEMVMNNALNEYEGGVKLGGETFNNLRYADDIVLMAETPEELQQITSRLERECIKYHLNINLSKTKLMKIGRIDEDVEVNLTTGRIEQVQEFKYLGVWFTQKGDTYHSVLERIKLGHTAMNRLSKIWKDRSISQSLKVRLYKAIVLPTVVYGAESWVLKQKEKTKLLVFEMYCLRRICNIRWYDRQTNNHIRNITNMNVDIINKINDTQRRWYGHVERMEARRLPRRLLYARSQGTRPRGRRRTPWLKTVERESNELSWRERVDLARDRPAWENYRRIRRDPTWRPPDGT